MKKKIIDRQIVINNTENMIYTVFKLLNTMTKDNSLTYTTVQRYYNKISGYLLCITDNELLPYNEVDVILKVIETKFEQLFDKLEEEETD